MERNTNTHGPEKEGRRADQAADQGRRSQPRPAGRSGTRAARRQHHGVLQGVQRRDGLPARQRRPGGDHRVRGPQLHVRAEDAASRQAAAQGREGGQGLGRTACHQGRQGHLGSGPRDRRDQEGRPERQRHRRSRQDHRRDRPVDGDHRRIDGFPVGGPAPVRHQPQPNIRLDYRMSKNSKAYRAALEKIDHDNLYTPLQAAKLAKETSSTKQDSTVEVAIRLGVDPRKADQMVRGTVNLPHGTGKTARVAVFAVGEKADEATAAGADVVGSDDLIEKIQGGFLDFDAAIATPDQMAKVGRIARILGPRGLMPNPKTGTVTPDITKAVSDIKGGKINFRIDKQANLHFVIGKASFDEKQLAENYGAALDEVLRHKPSSSKGRYLKKITVSTTTGPGIPVDPAVVRNFDEA